MKPYEGVTPQDRKVHNGFVRAIDQVFHPIYKRFVKAPNVAETHNWQKLAAYEIQYTASRKV
jgi:hypothetical protein